MLNQKFKILMKPETYIYHIFENILSITKTQTMEDNQSQRIENAFGRIEKTLFPCLEGSRLIHIDQNWEIKVSACSWSSPLSMLFSGFLDFQKFGTFRASKAKVYPLHFQNFLLLCPKFINFLLWFFIRGCQIEIW